MTEAQSVGADRTLPAVRAVLFDLDDTLFDHRHCARTALEAVHQSHDCFRGIPFDDFAGAHSDLLEQLHTSVMLGHLDVDAARFERFRRLFLKAGASAADDVIADATRRYRQSYVESRRSVAGATALLERVHERARVVVVSNNIVDEQRQKLCQCGLDRFVDALVVSEEVGVAKPDPGIFHEALNRAGCDAAAAVMVGDSWGADIRGARAVGIRAIWFNPLALEPPEVAGDVAELRSLEPVESVLEVIFNRANQHGHAHRS